MNLYDICREEKLDLKEEYPIIRNAILEKGIPYSKVLFSKDEMDIKSNEIPKVKHLIKTLGLPKSTHGGLSVQETMELNKELSKMLITSGFNFDGYKITKYSGYISGDDAISVNRGMAILGSGTDDVKDALLNSLVEIRRNALQELKQAAYDLGCNAVIGVDFDYITLDPQTSNLTGGTTYQPYVFCVTANGNAVVIEKTDD